MNLKFLEDVYQTYTDMRSSIYFLGYLAGIQAASFALYLAYKYMKDDSESKKDTKQVEENDEKSDTIAELQMEPIELENHHDNIKQDKIKQDKIEHDKDEKELYSLLTSKRDELENLINQLTTIQDNIMTIREKLEELNKK